MTKEQWSVPTWFFFHGFAARIDEQFYKNNYNLGLGKEESKVSFYINEKFHADAHYYLGFLTLDPSDNPDKMFNNAIMISIGYKFLTTSFID